VQEATLSEFVIRGGEVVDPSGRRTADVLVRDGVVVERGHRKAVPRREPRDQVRDGGTFTWPIDNLPPNYNYHQLDGTEVAASDVSRALVPSAYTADAAGNPVWSRALLASEPTLQYEPKQVVTFVINPKAAWYDGTPITWEDFHWQWRANNGSDKRYQIASANGWEAIESVQRGRDDREVLVTFRSRYADWKAVFSQIYPASTNRDPQEAVQQGLLREDLFYRLRVVPIKLPPLRKRVEDIPLLAEFFLKRSWERHRASGPPPALTADTILYLQSRPWRGNVRELQNVIEHVAVIAEAGRVLRTATETIENGKV
jgi:hypothetical protein